MCVCLLQAMVEQECVGAIVCKLDMHKKMFRRGYIAMLAVDSKHRRKSIGKVLKSVPLCHSLDQVEQRCMSGAGFENQISCKCPIDCRYVTHAV